LFVLRPDRRREKPDAANIHCHRIAGNGEENDRAIASVTPGNFNFWLYGRVGCDSKSNLADKSWASPQLVVDFPSTNQRADSFCPSGVNLEAKV